MTDAPAADWTTVREELATGTDTYWLTVPRASGVPHTRPLLVVWTHGLAHFACGPATAKGRLLAGAPPVSLSVSTAHRDLVVEGSVGRVSDAERVRAVAETYPVVYGWAPRPEGDLLTGPEGAPTAGPPPYAVFAVVPSTIYTFPTGDVGHGATRWRFADGSGALGGEDG
ncbi:pyridoxamine 5'-phosphate oxidase family protein [Nocardiopsis sp. MG754419]|nr:pyridoxamine 5'-phosphate oxidase family protein [Nocardiopsis sp. MG754419]